MWPFRKPKPKYDPFLHWATDFKKWLDDLDDPSRPNQFLEPDKPQPRMPRLDDYLKGVS